MAWDGMVQPTGKYWARSIQPKFPEILVWDWMNRFSPTGNVSKKLDYFSRLERSDRNGPFHFTIPTHSQSQYLADRYFPRTTRRKTLLQLLLIVNSGSIVVTHTSMSSLRLFNTIYFPREFGMFFSSFESGVWTHTANISKPYAYDPGGGGGGARRAAAPPVTEILDIFRAKRWWFGQKYLGENTLKGSQSYFLLRLPCQDGVKVKWCKDPGKVIYRLNVHRGNLTKWMLLPSTKLWQNQNKRRPRLFVVALKRVVLNGSTKSCFEIFLNFTYCFFYKFLILLGNRSRS